MRLLTDRELYTRYTTFVAGKLKDFFDRSVVTAIARSLRGASPGFNERAFVTMARDARLRLQTTVSFANLTTRKHYPGRHAVDALVNGMTFPLGELDVVR